MVPASFDFWRANLNREASSAGTSIPSEGLNPTARFGAMQFDGKSAKVQSFSEKTQMHEGWINGGFMLVEPEVLDYIPGDDTSFESDVLERISNEGKLGAYRHEGFWQSMDTLRDVRYLRGLLAAQTAPWVTWR